MNILNFVKLIFLMVFLACHMAKPVVSPLSAPITNTIFYYNETLLTVPMGTSFLLTPLIPLAGTYTYTISPVLPSGIGLNVHTGAISGAAGGLFPLTAYTVKATKDSTNVLTATFLLQITERPPASLDYPAGNILDFIKGSVGNFAATVVGGVPATFAASPLLPSGISVNSATGLISGTPVFPGTSTHILSATNSGGTATNSVIINIADLAPSALNYPGIASPLTLPRNTTMAPLTPNAETLASIITYSINPALPTGMSLDPSTGVISGTPSFGSSMTPFTVTKFNNTGLSQFSFNLAISNAPTALNYPAPMNVTRGIYNDTQNPLPSGGQPTSFSLDSGVLPTGMTLNTTTGAIFGTPTDPVGSFPLTISGTNPDGTISQSFTLNVQDAVVDISYETPKTIYVGPTVSLLPTVSGGVVDSYAITPALPAGLSFNTVTGEISGTFSTVFPLTSFSIGATNSFGTTFFTLQLQGKDSIPTSLGYFLQAPNSDGNYVFFVGVPLSSLTPAPVNGVPTSYYVTPALPSGLSLNATTGVISGTPAVAIIPTDFVFTGINSAGAFSETIKIEIRP